MADFLAYQCEKTLKLERQAILHHPLETAGTAGTFPAFFLMKTKVPAVLKTTQFTYFKANDGTKTIFGSRGFWRLNATLTLTFRGTQELSDLPGF